MAPGGDGAFQEALRSGMRELGLDPEEHPAFIEGCGRHHQMLVRWGEVHNLSTVRGGEDAADRHYLDSLRGLLAMEPLMPAGRPVAALDVGSGAGFPGVVGALWWPGCRWTLLDASAKRASFLQASAGGLANVRVCQARVESVRELFPVVVSRATLSADVGFGALLARLSEGGHAGLWVGESFDAAALPAGWGARLLVCGETRVAWVSRR